MPLTPEQAQILCDDMEIESTLNNEEEVECLEENNPPLLDAYRALLDLASQQ